MVEIKIGDLVKLPYNPTYWWSDQVGIIDLIEPEGSPFVEYRVFVPPDKYARFSDPDFVELISESR